MRPGVFWSRALPESKKTADRRNSPSGKKDPLISRGLISTDRHKGDRAFYRMDWAKWVKFQKRFRLLPKMAVGLSRPNINLGQLGENTNCLPFFSTVHNSIHSLRNFVYHGLSFFQSLGMLIYCFYWSFS